MALTQIKAGGLATDAVDSDAFVDGSIDHAHLANDAIDGDNIQDDVINSEHYAAASIDHEHLANDAVDGDNIADDVINSEHYAAASIDHEHLADDCVDGDNIADNSVGLAAMAGIARGKLIVGDSSGNPAYLAAGSNDHVLTMDANGDVGWEAAAAGGATINNATANEIVTVASTTTQLDAEANLTFDGTSLVLTGDQMIKANDAAAKLKFKSGNVATDDEEFGSITWQSSADNINASIAAHRATWANDGYLTFKTASSGTLSEQLRIDRFGNLDVARGNIEIKTNGKGIDFTANTDDESAAGSVSAEVLNDYETGTFTPTVDDGSATFGYSSQVGNYIKIGDLVHVELFIQLSSSSGTTANKVHIGGLPFSGQTANNAMRVGMTYGIADGDSPRIGRVNGNQIECFKDYGHSSALYNAAFEQGNERIAMSVTYLTS